MSYTKKEFMKQPAEFRIEAIVGDGMWYSATKWRKLAQVSESELQDWIQKKTNEGKLLQSSTGAMSYRYPYTEVLEWHNRIGMNPGDQVLEHIFPARVWDGKTETEGFLDAPLRTIDIVTFRADSSVAKQITQDLRGIARVRETLPGLYRAYCGCGAYVRELIEEKGYKLHETEGKRSLSIQTDAKRRELIDFSEEFCLGMLEFYRGFAASLTKPSAETISIFLPDQYERDAQILSWVLFAIEKFDESASVPFSGYLDNVLKRWPYDLPTLHLGSELSDFQRSRSRAIKQLSKEHGKTDGNFPNAEVAKKMGMEISEFNDLSERHRLWLRNKNATTLTWDEGDEKLAETNVIGMFSSSAPQDRLLAYNISLAAVSAALETGDYTSFFSLVSQMDTEEIDHEKLAILAPDFLSHLKEHLSGSL